MFCLHFYNHLSHVLPDSLNVQEVSVWYTPTTGLQHIDTFSTIFQTQILHKKKHFGNFLKNEKKMKEFG